MKRNNVAGYPLKEYEKPKCSLISFVESDVVRTSVSGKGEMEVGEEWSNKWDDGFLFE